jgi:hypothetical protein
MELLDRATRAQVAALQRIYAARYGHRAAGRGERLAAAARALGVDQLDSFAELTRGQAGVLFGAYRSHGTAGLDMTPADRGYRPATPTTTPDVATSANRGDTHGAGLAVAVWLVWLLIACQSTSRQDVSGHA